MANEVKSGMSGTRRTTALLFAAACLLIAITAAAADGSLKGKVSFRDKPLAGVVLQLRADGIAG